VEFLHNRACFSSGNSPFDGVWRHFLADRGDGTVMAILWEEAIQALSRTVKNLPL